MSPPNIPQMQHHPASTTTGSQTTHVLPTQLRLMRWVELAVVFFSVLLQLALFARSAATLTLRQHGYQAALLALRLSYLFWFAFMPDRTWLKCRSWVIGAMRLAIACVPTQRTSREGDAILLERAATPGARGALQDWLRLVTGSRLLPMSLIGSILLQSPLAVAVQQALLMVVTADNAGYCSTHLMAHPLTQHRLVGVWQMLETWAAVSVAATGSVPDGPTDLSALPAHEAALARCLAVLSWQQCVLGVLLPVLLAAGLTAPATNPPQRHSPVLAGEHITGQPQQHEQEHEQIQLHISPRSHSSHHSSHCFSAAVSCAQAVASAAGRAAARLDGTLIDWCRGDGMPMMLPYTAVFLLAGQLWLLAKEAGMRGVLQGGMPAAI